MAQNEKRERLIKDGKIVGHKWTISVGLACKYIPMLTRLHDDELIDLYCTGVTVNDDYWSQLPIIYDSFESGYQMPDGSWWFDGDRGDCKNGGLFTLVYSGCWGILFDRGEGKRSGLYNEPTAAQYYLGISKRIGSIHDEPTEEL